ncbi:hypothetical protein [Streptomyces spinosirectus]
MNHGIMVIGETSRQRRGQRLRAVELAHSAVRRDCAADASIAGEAAGQADS